ncbi:MAG: DUF948 domain-containing protein [Candidatus Kapabacteria bacterium]|nr:DUF948 domain-containing protein [Candidatus Kapabacteria bacterium]
MELTLSIAGLIAIIVFIVFCVYAIKSLRRITAMMGDAHETLRETKTIAQELSSSLPTTFKQITHITNQLGNTMNKVDTQLDTLHEGLQQFREVGERVNALESRLQDKLEAPLMSAASVVSGVSKAISAFASGLSRK